MIAIPVDTSSIDAKSSKLFGNVNYFALYNSNEDSFLFVKNEASGNGIKTAELLKDLNVQKVVYSYMGDGPFNTLLKNAIEVYFIGKEPLGLESIVKSVKEDSYIKVDSSNAATYLDPGTNTGNCECGCTHE
ncbi:NifB/NifX family molybdenum-iron cluster-binding protein [bacterium]|nr:NifB/NifX family molybdenum-iron cluster-binding protein [bacterium]